MNGAVGEFTVVLMTMLAASPAFMLGVWQLTLLPLVAEQSQPAGVWTWSTVTSAGTLSVTMTGLPSVGPVPTFDTFSV